MPGPASLCYGLHDPRIFMVLRSSLCWGHRLSASEMLKISRNSVIILRHPANPNVKSDCFLSADLFGLLIYARSFGLQTNLSASFHTPPYAARSWKCMTK